MIGRKRMSASRLTKLVVAVAVAFPMAAAAESNFTTGAGTVTASARLNFTVSIPKVIYLKVGTGGAGLAANATIDGVVITVPAANVGDGSAIASVPASVPVRVVGNNGNITLTAVTAAAGLANAAGDTISFAQIVGTSSDATAGGLAHPVFNGTGGSSTVTVTPNVTTKVTDRSANWSFTYSNAAVVPPGTYGGTVALGGQVTYTASMP
jgi:hypothetical protein